MQIRSYADVKVHIKTEDILKENVVYKLTFPNGKVYIGQTVQKLRNRLYAHCNEAFDKNLSSYDNVKVRAIRKYMTFKVDILYEGCDLDDNEIKFINDYNALNREFGYNLESGGNLNKHHSEESKKKMSLAKKGIIVSEESRKKMSLAHKGKTLSEETKKKVSLAQQGMIRSEETKKKMGLAKQKNIIVTDIKTGIETKFNSINSAAEYFDIKRKNISEVLSGRNKTFKKKQYTARYE